MKSLNIYGHDHIFQLPHGIPVMALIILEDLSQIVIMFVFTPYIFL